MVIAARALALKEDGDLPAAYELLAESADKDAEAAYLLGTWRMAGSFIRRDLGESRRLFGQAANLGHAEAEAHYVALLANGAGGAPRRWGEAIQRLRSNAHTNSAARRQLGLLTAMNLDEHGDGSAHYRPHPAHGSAPIWTIPGFLSVEEALYLMELAKPLLRQSTVVHPVSGALIRDPVRRSSAASFPFMVENPVVHAINRRIAGATVTSYEQGEPVQILAYDRGDEYKVHADALPNEANQRVLTFLVYLSDGFEGGETAFPKWDFRFKGRVGEAILFRNVDGTGRPDPNMVHAGSEVRHGSKFILSKWIRKAPLDLSGRPGRPF